MIYVEKEFELGESIKFPKGAIIIGHVMLLDKNKIVLKYLEPEDDDV